MAKLTTDDFITKAEKVHGDTYDYSLVKYEKSKIKVDIICKKHGVFQQSPDGHLNGRGCERCSYEYRAKAKTKDIDTVLEDFHKVHGDTYGYSKFIYKGCTVKSEIICSKHGSFFQSYSAHSVGKGCNKCGFERGSKKQTLSKQDFIKKAIKIHGDKYDYTESIYDGAKSKLKIKCLKHNMFFIQSASDHTSGCGCQKCADESRIKSKSMTLSEFVKRSKLVHGTFFDYSLVDYVNNNTKVCVVCPYHGKFFPTPGNHLAGSGCPACSESRGERSIRLILEKFNIEFIAQYSLIGKAQRKLRYDFYLPKYNLIIEFHGIQHYKPVELFGGILSLISTKKRDIIKKHYCIQNGIPFLEIPFWEQDNIETILSENINS